MSGRGVLMFGVVMALAGAAWGRADDPVGALAPGAVPAAAAPATSGEPAAPVVRVPGLEKRLAALTPSRPSGYFELGEEVAQEVATPEDRRLARQLFALAVELNRVSGSRDAQLERSACLALAAVAETDAEGRWLRALAASLEGAPAGALNVDARRVAPPREPAALELCTVLSYARTGEGRRASQLLAQPEVARLLEACDRLLGGGYPGGADRVKKAIDDWASCPQCHNRRFVKDAGGVRVCPFCHGTPGPRLSQAELVAQLRTEAVVLAGSQRSWAGQVISDAGAPLRELEAAEIAPSYGVSALRPVWRDGLWVEDASAPRAGAGKGGTAAGGAGPGQTAGHPASAPAAVPSKGPSRREIGP